MLVPLVAGQIDWQELERVPYIAAMAACPQEMEHHAEGDVLTHTKMVAAEGLKLAQEQNLDPTETQDLLYACIFHDIGKPITLAKEEDGKWTSRKHALKGTSFLRSQLWREGSPIPLDAREKLLALIALHAWPVRFIERTHPEDSVIRASLLTSNKLLGLLAIADMRGRICQNKDAQEKAILNAELYLEHAKELGCLNTPYPFDNARSRLHYLNHQGKAPPTNLFQEKTFVVTMMCGLPGSGKDHWLEKNYPKENLVISRDAIREELKRADEGEVLQELLARTKRALAKKIDFAINATNLRKELRQKTAALISAYGGQTHMVYLQGDRSLLLKRIAQREKNPKAATVPTAAIDKLSLGMEPPSLLECHQATLIDQNQIVKKSKNQTQHQPDFSL